MVKPTSGTFIPKAPILSFLFFIVCLTAASGQRGVPTLSYTVSMPDPSSHYYHVELSASDWNQDTLVLKMPKWTPGYYQILDYANAVENVKAKSDRNTSIAVRKVNGNSWAVGGIKKRSFVLSYDVKADKRFVAQCNLDSAHGYIVPAGLFLYVDKHLDAPVTIKINAPKTWEIVTGLEQGKADNEFVATDFDILYDCPILLGDLEALPSFKVRGIEHRFVGYKVGTFDRDKFMRNLEKVVAAAVNIIDDIPFSRYTFIGIGPGRGGIEHLNNTTISFDGSELSSPEAMNRMMNFLAHEYFHHYNVKRIRPLELGPFDYDKGSKTNLLWVSEGLTVYYEYLVVKRAGLVNEQTFLTNFEQRINAVENNPGRAFQSLKQASYETWSDGPFGTQGKEPGKAISYYDKGPLVGLLLDFAIRNATQNKRSLDDVMRLLYQRYYKELGRGFTDGEFEQTCEAIAGMSLSPLFEYVYTTRDLDYNKYLAYAGLTVDEEEASSGKQKRKFMLRRLENPSPLQSAIFRAWMGE
jgi:predicted metalloprotease with PDZ domain